MNNANTFTYDFSTFKNAFYNDFKEKIFKTKFVNIVNDYDIKPQRPEICPFCSTGNMYIKSTNYFNLKDYSTGPESILQELNIIPIDVMNAINS